MKNKEQQEAIKSFLYMPIKIGKEHNVFCSCGKKMKLKFSGASFSVGDCGFECDCGKKILFAWEYVSEFPSVYDEIKLNVIKKEK